MPLLALVAQEVGVDVLAQGGAHDPVALQVFERLGQVAGKLADVQAPLLTFRHLEDVVVDRGSAVEPLGDPVEA